MGNCKAIKSELNCKKGSVFYLASLKIKSIGKDDLYVILFNYLQALKD